MKKVFVIFAVIAMAGCSNMHMPWRSSTGSTSSSSMGSSSTMDEANRTGAPPYSQSNGQFTTQGAMNPNSADAIAPTRYLP